MQEIIWNRIKSESLKKLSSFFLLNPVPFNGQSYLKQKGPGTSGQLLFRLQNKFRKIPLFVIYYLNKFDDIKQFLSYSKNYICNFMLANSWHHQLFQFYLFFWVWKVWKGRGKIQKCEYLENEKSFFRWSKKHFSYFWRAIIWWKIKIW